LTADPSACRCFPHLITGSYADVPVNGSAEATACAATVAGSDICRIDFRGAGAARAGRNLDRRTLRAMCRRDPTRDQPTRWRVVRGRDTLGSERRQNRRGHRFTPPISVGIVFQEASDDRAFKTCALNNFSLTEQDRAVKLSPPALPVLRAPRLVAAWRNRDRGRPAPGVGSRAGRRRGRGEMLPGVGGEGPGAADAGSHGPPVRGRGIFRRNSTDLKDYGEPSLLILLIS